jgi:hypothetical protein
MYKVINKEQLIEANNIARHLNWPRHFKSDDFSDMIALKKNKNGLYFFRLK